MFPHVLGRQEEEEEEGGQSSLLLHLSFSQTHIFCTVISYTSIYLSQHVETAPTHTQTPTYFLFLWERQKDVSQM